MLAPTGLKELRQRKQLLTLQADLQRQLLVLECGQWQDRFSASRQRFQANRWWLAGGALAVGWLFTRKLPSLARWLPLALPAWRAVRRYLPR